METIIISGIVYAAIALLAARGGGFLRACDDAMEEMMKSQAAPGRDGRNTQQSIVIKEALS